jgi:hypothetical protein
MRCGSGRFSEADLCTALLAVDSGGTFGDPGSANAVLPMAFGAAHLKDGLPVAGIGIVSSTLPVAGGHGHAFNSAVIGDRELQQAALEYAPRNAKRRAGANRGYRLRR